MTLLLFTRDGQPIGRAERKLAGANPLLVTFDGLVFLYTETTPMGWHRYVEAAPLELRDYDVRLAPPKMG